MTVYPVKYCCKPVSLLNVSSDRLMPGFMLLKALEVAAKMYTLKSENVNKRIRMGRTTGASP